MMRPASTPIYLESLFRDSGLVELRHLDNSRATSGIFDDSRSLIECARGLSRAGNLYTSLNAPKLRKAENRMRGGALKDDDIGWITRLPFDFDPVRPTGVCSTEDELAAALDMRDRFIQAMHGRGWPLPLLGMSGNGTHVIHRCCLPSNAETREALTALYYGLHAEHDNRFVGFDRMVRNPSRVFRLYGSINRKGMDLIERPHRKSECWLPDRWRQVTRRQIMDLANLFVQRRVDNAPAAKASTAPVDGDGDYSTLDVVRWFQSHGLYKRPSPDGGGKHYVACPWGHEHSSADNPAKTDTVVWEADGSWPSFHCSHNHCAGRCIRDVMALFRDADSHCSQTWRAGK